MWDLTGEGAFSMVMQDIVTCVQYNLPSIHVVFSNEEYAFIKAEQEDTNHYYYGVDFQSVDYAKIAEAQGAVGLTVSDISDLHEVFQKAVDLEKSGKTVVVNVKISDDRPIPAEALELDPALYPEEEIRAFKERYEAEELVPFSQFLKDEGLESCVQKRQSKSTQDDSKVDTEEQI